MLVDATLRQFDLLLGGDPRTPNRRLQLTAFGARDRAHFDTLRSAPRRQLKRRTLGRAPSMHARVDS